LVAMQDLKSLVESVKMFSFDIDGTIIDSYSYMRDVIEILLLYLGVPPGMLQPVSNMAVEAWYEREKNATMDYSRMYDLLIESAEKNGITLIGKREEFNELLLEARVKASQTLPCAVRVLRQLKAIGKIVVTVSGGDGVPGMKRKRIELGGLSKFFDLIAVVPEDYPSRIEALARLASQYGLSYNEVAHIDDRAEYVNSIAEAGFKAVLVKTGMLNTSIPLRDDIIVLDNLCILYETLVGKEQAAKEKP